MNHRARTLLNWARSAKHCGAAPRKSLRWLKRMAHKEARRNADSEIRAYVP